MRVLVFGQRRWGAYLARQLNRYGSAWSIVAEYLNVAAPNFRVPRVAAVRRADVIVRVGYPVGAPSIRGRTFDLLWRWLHVINPSALYLHYWIGTDVQSVTRYRAAGRLRSGVFKSALGEMHAALTPWLVDELRELSVDAIYLPFDGLDLPRVDEKDLVLPSQFTVLTYIPDERWAFYGGAQLIEAARRLPQVLFVVVAGRGGWLADRPGNVTFLGWRDDMVEVYKDSTVLLRLAEHDALGCTVVEGLGMARHVLYNYPVPFTTKVTFDDVDGLVAAISRLWDSHASGALLPNLSGRRWAESTYDEGRLIRTLCEALAERRGSGMNETSEGSGTQGRVRDVDCAGAPGCILFVANVDSHIWAFHMPYMRLLRDMGYEVEVAAAPAGCADRIRAEGYEVHSIPFARNPLSTGNVSAFRCLSRLMRDRHYVMVHAHTPVGGFLGRLAARRQGVPHIIYTAHGFHFHTHGKWWSNRLYYTLERLAARWTDTLITINREDFAVASHDFARGRTQVVYVAGVGTDCSEFAPGAAGQRDRERILLGLRRDAVVIVWVAEFIKRKRPIDAVTAMRESGLENRAQLTMLGSGPLLDGIMRVVRRDGMRDAVTCRGRVANVPEYLAASDVFLSTAGQEGLPRNVMEAMAAALPVVAYDIRGCNDLVVDGHTGFLVPLGDVHGLADKLVWLAQHPDERCSMGTAGRRRIEETFSLATVLPQMKKIYENELQRVHP